MQYRADPQDGFPYDELMSYERDREDREDREIPQRLEYLFPDPLGELCAYLQNPNAPRYNNFYERRL